MDLHHPALGSTDWGTDVNDNWDTLEAALTFNAGRIPFSDGTTLVDNSALFWDNTNSRLGINTATPRRRVDVLDTTNPQVRLSHTDNSVYTDLQTNSSGNFRILPTGSVMTYSTASPYFIMTGSATNQTLTFEFDESQASKGRLLYAGGNGAGARYLGLLNDAADYLYLSSTNTIQLATVATIRGKVDANGNFIWGTAALATTATNGFVYIPTCAGTPTGTPTSSTGTAPIVYDTTNKKFWIYDTATTSWKGVVVA